MSMQDLSRISGARQQRALWLSTFALAVCFAVWVIFSIVGIQLQQDLGLSGTQFGLLVAAPILTGSISRPVLGIWAEMIGAHRSEEDTSELQSLMRISYAVFCLKNKNEAHTPQ